MILEEMMHFQFYAFLVQKYIFCLSSSYVFITHDPREKLITKAEFDVAQIQYIHSRSLFICVATMHWCYFPFLQGNKKCLFQFFVDHFLLGQIACQSPKHGTLFSPSYFFSSMGSTNNYVDKTLAFFNLPTSTWMFFTLNENVDKNKPLWFLNWIG